MDKPRVWKKTTTQPYVYVTQEDFWNYVGLTLLLPKTRPDTLHSDSDSETHEIERPTSGNIGGYFQTKVLSSIYIDSDEDSEHWVPVRAPLSQRTRSKIVLVDSDQESKRSTSATARRSSQQKTQGSNNIDTDEESELPAIPTTRRRPLLVKQNKRAETINLSTDTDTGFTTSSTRSYKYGVTMSDSDVPGVDISKYMVG